MAYSCTSSTDWIVAIALSSRSAISRLVVSSRRDRAVSPSSAAARRVQLRGETLFVAVSLLSPFDSGIKRVQRERETLDRGIDCALLRHRLWPTPKTCAAAAI